NQRLALLLAELEQLREKPSDAQNRAEKLREAVIGISTDVQALSHELHSSKLEYLGAVRGMRSLCREFAVRQKLEIDFRSDVSSVLTTQVGLSLFRVLQEALHNAEKYSDAKRIEVQLREDPTEIHLIICDSGKGFDVEAALNGSGLGLTSMRERVRLAGGTIAIHSKPMVGTRIYVRVPLGLVHEAQRAG